MGCGARGAPGLMNSRMSFEGVSPSEPCARGCSLADTGKDIERPLGQTVRSPRATGKLGGGTIAATVVVLAVVGVSGAIALREKPFRKPQEVAVSTPKVTAAAEPAAAPAALAPVAAAKPEAPPRAGPQIIHADRRGWRPATSSTTRRPGQNLKIALSPDRADRSQRNRAFACPRRRWWRPSTSMRLVRRAVRVAIVIGGLVVSQTGTQRPSPSCRRR